MFGATNTQSTGSYAVQPTTTTYNVPQNATANAPITLDTPYMKLPTAARDEIDAAFDKFKKPSREYLADITDQKDGFMDDLSERLKAANLLLIRSENKQLLVRNDLSALRDDAMQVCAEARKSGHSCLEEVRQYGSGRLRKSDHASKFQANEFFLAAFARLARRLEVFADEAARIERQLVSMQAIATRKRESYQDVGVYGESPKIGLHELVQLIKNQHAAFLAVTARIAECHRDADHLRAAFKKCFPSYASVFEDEDRREAADGRMSSLREKELFREHLVMEARGSNSNPTGGTTTGTQGSSNSFYASVNSTTNAAAPAAAPNTASFSLSGFGSSSATAAPTTSSFGATSTTNAFSSAAPATTGGFGSTAAPATTGGFGATTTPVATGGFGSTAAPAASAFSAAPAAGATTAGSAWGAPAATSAAPTTGFGGFGAAQPAAAGANALGTFGSTQPQTSASAGDLAGVGMNRSFSTTFGSVSGTASGADSKSKSRSRRNR